MQQENRQQGLQPNEEGSKELGNFWGKAISKILKPHNKKHQATINDSDSGLAGAGFQSRKDYQTIL
jgi:cytoplasmic iron level regulating protein YaaA (DUF328/UPF0246 family)